MISQAVIGTDIIIPQCLVMADHDIVIDLHAFNNIFRQCCYGGRHWQARSESRQAMLLFSSVLHNKYAAAPDSLRQRRGFSLEVYAGMMLDVKVKQGQIQT